jgi:hypothetical protein
MGGVNPPLHLFPSRPSPTSASLEARCKVQIKAAPNHTGVQLSTYVRIRACNKAQRATTPIPMKFVEFKRGAESRELEAVKSSISNSEL